MYYVYKATNRVNGKCYIGITSREIDCRWREHLSRSRNNDRNSRLYAAMRKYGSEAFVVEVLDQSDTEESIRELERKYIASCDSYNNGYNCNLGGEGFLKFPEEIRRKISESQKGKVIPEAVREKMSKAKRGDSRCAEHLGAHVNVGRDNPRSKYFMVETPDGNIIVDKGLRAFCRNNNLLHCKLSSNGRTKGYTLLGTFNDHPFKE